MSEQKKERSNDPRASPEAFDQTHPASFARISSLRA